MLERQRRAIVISILMAATTTSASDSRGGAVTANRGRVDYDCDRTKPRVGTPTLFILTAENSRCDRLHLNMSRLSPDATIHLYGGSDFMDRYTCGLTLDSSRVGELITIEDATVSLVFVHPDCSVAHQGFSLNWECGHTVPDSSQLVVTDHYGEFINTENGILHWARQDSPRVHTTGVLARNENCLRVITDFPRSAVSDSCLSSELTVHEVQENGCVYKVHEVCGRKSDYRAQTGPLLLAHVKINPLLAQRGSHSYQLRWTNGVCNEDGSLPPAAAVTTTASSITTIPTTTHVPTAATTTPTTTPEPTITTTSRPEPTTTTTTTPERTTITTTTPEPTTKTKTTPEPTTTTTTLIPTTTTATTTTKSSTPPPIILEDECGGLIELDCNGVSRIDYKSTKSYGSNERCSWLVSSRSSSVDLMVNLENIEPYYDGLFIFPFPQTESSGSCIKMARDGAEKYGIRRTLPNLFVLHFTSDNSVNRKGFIISLTSTGTCRRNEVNINGFHSNNPDGTYSYPSDGLNYTNNARAMALVQADTSRRTREFVMGTVDIVEDGDYVKFYELREYKEMKPCVAWESISGNYGPGVLRANKTANSVVAVTSTNGAGVASGYKFSWNLA